MFLKAIAATGSTRIVSMICADVDVAERLKSILESSGRFEVEWTHARVAEADPRKFEKSAAALRIVEVSSTGAEDIAALTRLKQVQPLGAPLIVVSNDLAETDARQFIRLGVADWLRADCSGEELLAACEVVLQPQQSRSDYQASCTGFVSAVGGAGATTLAIATATIAAGKDRDSLRQCCAVDFDLMHGSLTEYLDIIPALQVEELGNAPERLDRHLLEIMIARHSSGLAVLAAPPVLEVSQSLSVDVIGRLLDLAAADFDHLIIDLPTHWQSWSSDIARGLDDLFVVTEMSVVGVRQARRIAEAISDRCSLDLTSRVIVNKARRFGGALGERQAKEALGTLFGGTVGDHSSALRSSQDRGELMKLLRKRNRFCRELSAILSQKSRPATAMVNASGRPGK